GYLSTEGILIQPQFRTAGPFEHGTASACVDSGCGLIDIKGHFLTSLFDPKAVHLDVFHEGLLADEKDRKWGFIDAARRVVIPYQYLYVTNFDYGTAKVSLEGKEFFVNHAGERVTPEFEAVSRFTDGIAAAKLDVKWGYIRCDAVFVVPQIYDSAEDFSD